MVVSALFILVGVIAIWDTTSMVDADSFVYPRAVAIIMIVLAIVFIVLNLLRPAAGETIAANPGSTPRRIGLVIVMLGCAAAMPFTGFFIAGLGAFFAIMLIAMYEPWTRFSLIVYPIVCVAVVTGFYALFKKALLVPLPEAPFF
jgi:putative tricarboxylic transport membrane protein